MAASSTVTASANPGAWPMPPPSTISDGSMTEITQQIAAATRRASPATTAAARSSPAAAAAKTSLAVARPVRPDLRAARTMPSAPAAISRVPRRCASSGSMITPSGPAVTRSAGTRSAAAGGQCAVRARGPGGPGGRVAAERQEGDLPGHPVHAAVQPAAEHQAHADARADVHPGEAVGLLPDAERALGERGRVHVVLDRERGAERRPQPGERLRLVPAGQAAGQRHQVPLRVVDARAADNRRGDLGAGDPGARAQLVGELDKLRHPVADRCRAHRHGQPGADVAGQVGDGTAQVAHADVEAEDEPGLRPDLVEQGGTAGHAGPLAGQPDQAGPLQVRQGERHGGLGQPGHAGELRARVGARRAGRGPAAAAR